MDSTADIRPGSPDLLFGKQGQVELRIRNHHRRARARKFDRLRKADSERHLNMRAILHQGLEIPKFLLPSQVRRARENVRGSKRGGRQNVDVDLNGFSRTQLGSSDCPAIELEAFEGFVPEERDPMLLQIPDPSIEPEFAAGPTKQQPPVPLSVNPRRPIIVRRVSMTRPANELFPEELSRMVQRHFRPI